MQTFWKQAVFLMIGTITLTGAGAHAQTDISASVFGALNNSSSGNGATQSSANSGGGMIGLRHIFKPLLGVEANFAVSGAGQSLAPVQGSCGDRCQNPPLHVSTDALEFSVNYVASAKLGRLEPFGTAGLGFTFFNASGSEPGLNSLSRPTWVGGGGTDLNLTSRVGLRLQYRVNFYKAPDVALGYAQTGAFVHTQEPMVGIFFRM